jgi:hypothetical protein
MARVVPQDQPDADVAASDVLAGATIGTRLTADRSPADGADGSTRVPSVADPEVRSLILPSAVSDEESTLWTA